MKDVLSENKELENEYRAFLDTLPLVNNLRSFGREIQVRPSLLNARKSLLIDAIVDILMGRTEPAPPSGRGRHVKSEPDLTIMPKLEEIRTHYAQQEWKKCFHDRQKAGETGDFGIGDLIVASPEPVENIYRKQIFSGILEIMPSGYGFLRARNCQPTNGEDVFIPAPIIHAMKLREGDFICCTVKPRVKNDSAAIEEIESVNGLGVGKYEARDLFDKLTACYPKEKIRLSDGESKISLRLLDFFVPIGKGQRALIIAPPKAGKTTLLKDIARAIAANHREIQLIVLLIDERPEEVTDFCESVHGAEVIYSTFDEGADHHVRAAELTVAHAKRMAEQGQDVVILLDSLTKLTRAYNYVAESTGKTLSGGLDAAALAEPKRFFGAARNTLEQGSVTILATALVDTGSRMDDVIYEEFKGTGNADIFLSRDLAERRIFPAIDIRRSGTRKEELLLSEEELAAVYKLRERGLAENVEGVLDMLKKTKNNGQFMDRLEEWLKIYKTK